MCWLRIDEKTSKACCAPGTSAYVTVASDHSRRASTNERAWSTGARVSLAPVDHEEVRRVLVDVAQRRGLDEVVEIGLGVLLEHPRAQEAIAHVDGCLGLGQAGQVVDAVEGDACGDRRVRVLETGLVLRLAGCERGQGGEVTTRGSAGDRDVRRVAAVVGDVLVDPGDGSLHVDDLGGEGVLGGEPVVGGDADPALLGHPVHQEQTLLTLGADGPAAAVDLDQHRRALEVCVTVPILLGPVDVEPGPAPALGVRDVTDLLDILLAEAERLGDRSARQLQVDRSRQVEGGQVVLADALLKCFVELGAEAPRAGDGVPEQSGSGGGRDQSRLRRCRRASAHGQLGGGVGDGGGQQVRSQLAHGPAEGERGDADPPAGRRPNRVQRQRGQGELATSKPPRQCGLLTLAQFLGQVEHVLGDARILSWIDSAGSTPASCTWRAAPS